MYTKWRNRWRWNQECCFCCCCGGCCVREREFLAIKLAFWPVSKWLSEIRATLPLELNAYTASASTTMTRFDRFDGKIQLSKICTTNFWRIKKHVNSSQSMQLEFYIISTNCDIKRIESIQKQFLIFSIRKLGWVDRFRLPSYKKRLLFHNESFKQYSYNHLCLVAFHPEYCYKT